MDLSEKLFNRKYIEYISVLRSLWLAKIKKIYIHNNILKVDDFTTRLYETKFEALSDNYLWKKLIHEIKSCGIMSS